MQNTETAQKFL